MSTASNLSKYVDIILHVFADLNLWALSFCDEQGASDKPIQLRQHELFLDSLAELISL